MRSLLIAAIRGYQLLTAWMPGVCRFNPTCSTYAIGAIRLHGPARGSLLAVQRILRCHPWHPGGDDPVPPVAQHG